MANPKNTVRVHVRNVNASGTGDPGKVHAQVVLEPRPGTGSGLFENTEIPNLTLQLRNIEPPINIWPGQEFDLEMKAVAATPATP